MSSNWARSTAPRNLSFPCATADPLGAADNYLISKEVTRALALQRGFIASYMPKPFADLAGNGLHVHLALWDRASGDNLMAGSGIGKPAERNRPAFPWRLAGACPGHLRRGGAHRQLLQAAAARFLGAGSHRLGRRQSWRASARARCQPALPRRIPRRRQYLQPLFLFDRLARRWFGWLAKAQGAERALQ